MHASTQDDKQSIRNLIAVWLAATADGDLPKLLSLMAEDVVFLVPGHSPMQGREAFAASFTTLLKRHRVEAQSEIKEIEISGSLAYCWNHLSVAVIPLQGGSPIQRAGYTLTILRKEPDGQWIVVRDANMITAGPA